MLPIQDDAFAGAVVVAGVEASMCRFEAAPEAVAVLGDAIRLVVSRAWTRCSAEAQAEELLDLNRRLHSAQAEVAKQRSLAMIAQMAAGAAHELNNPLAVISGRAQMELEGCTDPQHRRAFEIIIEQTRRAADIVSELMRFAKPEPPNPTPQPLAKTLQDICQHWRERSGVSAAVPTVHVPDPRAVVSCDAQHLREMLEAVLTNALEATTGDTRRIQVNSPSRASDETVRIRVEDNGWGMVPEVLEHAVDPLFSSRPAGRGRGLGLSRAYRLAEINGGRLWIESQPHVGTTVTIELPAHRPGA